MTDTATPTYQITMRLCHPPDGSTSRKYKLLCFITAKINCKEKNALAFNQDRCCHLVLCFWLIPFNCPKLPGFRLPVQADKDASLLMP